MNILINIEADGSQRKHNAFLENNRECVVCLHDHGPPIF